jgi:hypothetical protein
MKQCQCGFVCHAAVTIGSACDDTLEQAENRAHPGLGIHGGYQLHFGSARVCETYLDADICQRLYQSIRSRHLNAPLQF